MAVSTRGGHVKRPVSDVGLKGRARRMHFCVCARWPGAFGARKRAMLSCSGAEPFTNNPNLGRCMGAQKQKVHFADNGAALIH